MNGVPVDQAHLLEDETKAYAFLATLMGDGSPQVTPLWFNVVGDQIWINSAKGRTKDRNMRNRPQVALAIMDLKKPNNYLQVRGVVVEVVEEGADAHIDALAMKYQGTAFGGSSDQTRVIYKIQPESFTD